MRKHKKKVGDTEPVVVAPTRPEKWTPEEEFALSKAWVDVSEDSIVGRNQKGPDFWSKVRSHFFQAMSRGEHRTNDMISSKWRDINRKVKRFNEIYSQKLQTRQSGQSDAMIESEAVDQFRQDPGSSDAQVQINLSELDEEEEDDEIEDLTRPIGRDRAKADQARGSSSQTTPDYNQGMKNLSQRIGDFNELKWER
ncbi:hypothetical protein R6Q57_005141 [Mikania cordata]